VQLANKIFKESTALIHYPTNLNYSSAIRPSTKPGRHWISIFVSEDGRGEYFDSFERPPTKHFVDYLNEHCRNWIYNKKQLQGIISTFCGYYCCMYCIYRRRGFDLLKIINLFSTDTAFYDSIVHGFICKNKSCKCLQTLVIDYTLIFVKNTFIQYNVHDVLH